MTRNRNQYDNVQDQEIARIEKALTDFANGDAPGEAVIEEVLEMIEKARSEGYVQGLRDGERRYGY